MKHLSVVALLAFCAVQFVYGTEIKKLADDDGQYEIIDGDCYSALARDMIYKEHVHKTRLPFVSREAKSSWSGDAKIYCLRVLNDKDESKGSTCSVIEGGVGFSNVTIEMHSKANHGLEFDIEVYAR